jgi:hypothetical protein
MTDRKKPQPRATRKSTAREVTPDDTAERLAALLTCERLPVALRDVLQSEVLAFIERLGSFLSPDVLRLMYPALCLQAGDDPLRRVVESLARPERLPKGERGDAGRIPMITNPRASKYLQMPDDTLSHLGIFKGDNITVDLAKDIQHYERLIESGDLVVLCDDSAKPAEWHAGELRVEGDRVLLVSTYPAKVFRSKDVALLGRVVKVMRYVKHRSDREGGASC